jgi:hypothetical protein
MALTESGQSTASESVKQRGSLLSLRLGPELFRELRTVGGPRPFRSAEGFTFFSVEDIENAKKRES